MLDCVCCCVAGGISDADKKRTTQLVSHYREGKEVDWSLHIYQRELGVLLQGVALVVQNLTISVLYTQCTAMMRSIY